MILTNKTRMDLVLSRDEAVELSNSLVKMLGGKLTHHEFPVIVSDGNGKYFPQSIIIVLENGA